MKLVNIVNGDVTIEFAPYELPMLSLVGEMASEAASGASSESRLPSIQADFVGMYASLFTAFCDAVAFAAEPEHFKSLNEKRATFLYYNGMKERGHHLYPTETAAIEAIHAHDNRHRKTDQQDEDSQ